MADNWLVVETSGRTGSVGVAVNGALARTAGLDAARRHARDLTPTIDALLKAEGLRVADLTGIMVSVGPGSYTGLRVGLTTAKALAYTTGCALVPVPTFHAIAEQAPVDAATLWVIADALQGMVYVQRFARDPAGVWAPADELRIDRVEDWLNWAAAGTWMTGPGLSLHANRIPPDCPQVPEADRDPRPESVFAAGRRLAPVTREELFRLEPLYLRGSSAEEKAKRDAAKPATDATPDGD